MFPNDGDDLPVQPVDTRARLRSDLLSNDVERQRLAAAHVRATMAARNNAQRFGTMMQVWVGDELCEVPPTSPLLSDITELSDLADRVVPVRDDVTEHP